jgi:hypothetical protein
MIVPKQINTIAIIIFPVIFSLNITHDKKATNTKFNDVSALNNFKGISCNAITETSVISRNMAYALIVYTFRYGDRWGPIVFFCCDPIFRSTWLILVKRRATSVSARYTIMLCSHSSK